jgi:hypothetical protein
MPASLTSLAEDTLTDIFALLTIRDVLGIRSVGDYSMYDLVFDF